MIATYPSNGSVQEVLAKMSRSSNGNKNENVRVFEENPKYWQYVYKDNVILVDSEFPKEQVTEIVRLSMHYYRPEDVTARHTPGINIASRNPIFNYRVTMRKSYDFVYIEKDNVYISPLHD